MPLFTSLLHRQKPQASLTQHRLFPQQHFFQRAQAPFQQRHDKQLRHKHSDDSNTLSDKVSSDKAFNALRKQSQQAKQQGSAIRKRLGLEQRLGMGLRLSLMFFSSMLFFAHSSEAPLTFTFKRLPATIANQTNKNEQPLQAIEVTENSFPNQYLLLAIGFTTCPDICPTTLLDLRNMLAELDKTPAVAEKVQPLFVTIDPLSDSLKAITDYTAFFDPRIIGLWSDDFQALDDFVAQLGASYGYLFEGKPVSPPDLPKGYTVLHSVYIYLYSPDGKLLDAYTYDTDGKVLADSVRHHIANAPNATKSATKNDAQNDVQNSDRASDSDNLSDNNTNDTADTPSKPIANCQTPKPFKALDNAQSQAFLARDALHFDEKTPQQLSNLWAVWCQPCRKELPFLQQLHNDKRTQVTLVNIEDSPEEAQAQLDTLNVTLATQYAKMELLDELGIQGLPATVVKQGKRIFLGVGQLKDEQAIRDWLKCLND